MPLKAIMNEKRNGPSGHERNQINKKSYILFFKNTVW